MKKNQKSEIVYAITIEDLQSQAIEKLGRTLTEEEIDSARKGLEEGLLFDIDTVYDTIFSEIIEG